MGGGMIKFYELLCSVKNLTASTEVELFMSQFTGGLFFVAYFTFAEAIYSQTLGKKLMQIQTLHKNTGMPLTLKQSYWRALSYLVSSWTYGIGFILPLVRKDNLALHDLLCNTQVVESESSEASTSQQLELPFLASVHQIRIARKESVHEAAQIKIVQ